MRYLSESKAEEEYNLVLSLRDEAPEAIQERMGFVSNNANEVCLFLVEKNKGEWVYYCPVTWHRACRWINTGWVSKEAYYWDESTDAIYSLGSICRHLVGRNLEMPDFRARELLFNYAELPISYKRTAKKYYPQQETETLDTDVVTVDPITIDISEDTSIRQKYNLENLKEDLLPFTVLFVLVGIPALLLLYCCVRAIIDPQFMLYHNEPASNATTLHDPNGSYMNLEVILEKVDNGEPLTEKETERLNRVLYSDEWDGDN